MECEDVKASLLEHLRAELQPGQQAEVERHLDTCSSCALAYATAAASWRALDDSPGEASPRLREGFYSMLGKESAARAGVSGTGRERRAFLARFSRPTWVYAYSFLLMLSGMLVGESLRPAERLVGVELFAQASEGELTRERLVQLCSVSGAGFN